MGMHPSREFSFYALKTSHVDRHFQEISHLIVGRVGLL